MSKLKRSATINIHNGLRKFLKDYCSKLDPKKKISALDWLDSDDTEKQSEDKAVINRNSVEDDSVSSDDEEPSVVAVSDWPDSEDDIEQGNVEFEDFSATDTENEEEDANNFEISDVEDEDELFDSFDVELPPRRKSTDDILSPSGRVHEVKLHYTRSLCEQRSDESGRLSFLRSRTLGERLRDTRTWATSRRSSEKELTPILDNDRQESTSESPNCMDGQSPGFELGSQSRLSRLFSLRRSIDAPGAAERGHQEHTMHPLAEEEEAVLCQAGPMAAPPALPPPPMLMSPDQTKRRFIINSLVQSENNYLDSLNRLVNDYKKPLEESNPPILTDSKVATMFYRVPEILQCHSQFRIALTEAVKNWDEDEKIGDVFVASFSKSVVLEVYSDFINNFTEAMDLAKCESKRKSAFADFLKVKQITAHDRLNFFGLMVKPIQRFPQFILLLQDLLKETPPGHDDRMALQLALTTLESLAEMLNERKRECEQAAAFREKLRAVGGKIGKSEGTRMLLREDDVQRLEFNSAGQISRTKGRRLLLLNDRVVCVTVTGRPSETDVGNNNQVERLSLKWSAHVSEVEVVEGNATGTLARLTSANTLTNLKKTSLGKTNSTSNSVDKQMAENLAQDMGDLMHDFDVVSRINSMIGTLKCSYPGLTSEAMAGIMDQIQKSIRQKDDEMSWLDKSCLQLVVKRKDKSEPLTFQMRSPAVKQDWVVELRLARLALDPNNSPGWDILEQTKSITGRLPLYVKHLSCYHSESKNTEVMNGTSYTLLVPTPTRTLRPVTYVWANATDGMSSFIKIYSVQVNQQIALKDLGTTVLSSCCARSIVYVPGTSGGVAQSNSDNPLRTDLVWIATDDRRILLYAASDPEKGFEVGRIVLPVDPSCQIYHCGKVFVGLVNGSVSVFRRDHTVNWDLNNPQNIVLGSDPITCLLPVSGALYASIGRKILMLDAWSNSIVRSFTANIEENPSSPFQGSVASLLAIGSPGCVAHMAVCGVGLWISMANSSTIALYHTESFIHMQDINIANNVSRVLAAREVSSNKRSIYVTALAAAKGLLWVGTNVGIALTIPLPRLEGVPIISGKANISYHAHFGPVRMFLPLQPKVHTSEASTSKKHQSIPEESVSPLKPYKKQISESVISSGPSTPQLNKQFSSPVMRSKSSVSSKEQLRKSSKTLPRGFTIAPGSESSGESVFGLYGDLMNVEEYDCDSTNNLEGSTKDIHKSDPELDTIPYRIGTLDRRVAMKSNRPRSLDLSSWSVESKGSSQTTSSSENGSQKTSPSVSRTASCASDSNTSESSWTTNKTNSSTLSKTLTREGKSKDLKSKHEIVQRTVTTLMGGRGYIQWRATHLERNKTSHLAQINNSDAYLVIWDHKL